MLGLNANLYQLVLSEKLVVEVRTNWSGILISFKSFFSVFSHAKNIDKLKSFPMFLAHGIGTSSILAENQYFGYTQIYHATMVFWIFRELTSSPVSILTDGNYNSCNGKLTIAK